MDAFHRFRVGDVDCVALSDGVQEYTADDFVAGGDPGTVGRAFARYGATPDSIPSTYTCLHVESAGHRVLVDTGAGSFGGPTAGKLAESMSAAGIRPEDVDVVLLTHCHPDHIGWLVQDGSPVFGNARHVLLRVEWEHWTNPAVLASDPEVFGDCVHANLLPVQNRVELLDGETEVAPGITMVPAPGHTPGHAVVLVAAAGEELLYIADTALHQVHLDEPDWYPVYDVDPQQALASKRVVFDRAADFGSLVLAFHFAPFPSLGRLSRAGAGWVWSPEPTTVSARL